MQHSTNATLLTCEELSARIKYEVRYIREHLKDSVFIEGVHYIRPFGRRKILFIWEAVERDMFEPSAHEEPMIPLAAGGAIRG